MLIAKLNRAQYLCQSTQGEVRSTLTASSSRESDYHCTVEQLHSFRPEKTIQSAVNTKVLDYGPILRKSVQLD